MQITRRSLLSGALGSGVAAAAGPLKIVSVRAWPVDLAVTLGGTFRREAPKFSSDFDPRRARWFGPFAQLVGAIVVEVRTDQRYCPAGGT